MKVMIENMFFGWHEKLPEAFTTLVNTLVLAKSEAELREIMTTLSGNKDFDNFFLYGFGHHHLWVKQKGIPTTSDKEDYRLLIVEF